MLRLFLLFVQKWLAALLVLLLALTMVREEEPQAPLCNLGGQLQFLLMCQLMSGGSFSVIIFSLVFTLFVSVLATLFK